MSRHSQTHHANRDTERATLPASRPFSQPPKSLSPSPARNAGHDFRQIAIFSTAAIQRKGDGGGGEMADVPVASGGGETIPDAVRAAMEASFAQDFGDVRIHTGPEAKQVGALAYTRGSDLHFQPGRYDPFSDAGRSLLGHELTHVVQQRAGRVAAPRQNKSEGAAPINADAGLEAEADAQGARAARGQRASVSGAGAGVQRKAEDAPIQREEDEVQPKAKDIAEAKEIAEAKAAGKYYQTDAAKKPNEFLPSRLRPKQLVNTSPERSQVRHNGNGTVFQPDVARVNTFRNRMAGEMAAQKTMLGTNDEAAQFPVHPLAKPGPAGWDQFQQQQRLERDKELDALSEGKTASKPKQSGIFERPEAVNNFTPRPAATETALNPAKYVTAGTVAGQTAYNGGDGDTVTTRSGPANGNRLGWLENRLNNPQHNPALVDNQGHHNFPREPMAVRQQHLIQTAQKADPLMRDLINPANNDTLPTHVDKNNRLAPNHGLRAGTAMRNGIIGNIARNKQEYAVGAVKYGNREQIVPNLVGPHVAPSIANETKSRTNLWSEADLDPVKGHIANNGYVTLQNRGTDRLLHTASNSQAEVPNGTGGMSPQQVDHRFSVTNDHYKTAVPVSPVAQGYKNNLPVNHPYKTSTLDAPLAAGALGPTRSSLNVHENNEAKRIKQSAGDDNLLRFQTTESLREQAGADAKQGTKVRNVEEAKRVKMAELTEDDPYIQAGRDAKQGTRVRDVEEGKRVKMAGMIEDDLYAQAGKDALAASAKREAEEEARTQADLKALAPSDSVQAMYGMGKAGANKMAAQSLEQQHLGIQEFLKSGEAKPPPAPMSDAAKEMYG